MVEDWILAFAASPLVYVALYVLTTIDGFFPPIPSESVVIALAAVAMTSGEPNLALLVAVAAAGAFTGDQIAFAIGRRVHVRSSRLLRSKRAQRTLDWAEYALAHRGASFIIGARYIPVGRVAVNMTAGAVGYPRRRFVGLTAFGAVSWGVYSTAIGVGAGAWLGDRPLVAVGVGVVSGVIIGLVVDGVLGQVQNRSRLHRAAVARRAAQAAAEARGEADGDGSARDRSGRAGSHAAAPVGVVALADPAPVLEPVPAREPAAAMVLPGADCP